MGNTLLNSIAVRFSEIEGSVLPNIQADWVFFGLRPLGVKKFLIRSFACSMKELIRFQAYLHTKLLCDVSF